MKNIRTGLACLAFLLVCYRPAEAKDTQGENAFNLAISMPQPVCSSPQTTQNVREALDASCNLIGQSLLVGRGPWGLGVFDSFTCSQESKLKEETANWILEITSGSDGILFRLLYKPLLNSKKAFLQAQVVLPSTNSILNHLTDKTFVRHLAGALIDQLPLQGKISENKSIPVSDSTMKYVKISLEDKEWLRVDLVGFDSSRGYWDLDPKTGNEGAWIVSREGRGKMESAFREAFSNILFKEISQKIGVGEDSPPARSGAPEANWNECKAPKIPAAVADIDSNAEISRQVTLRSTWAPKLSLTGQESGFGEQIEVFPSTGRFAGLVLRSDYSREKHSVSLRLSGGKNNDVAITRQHVGFEIGWRAFFPFSNVEAYSVPSLGFAVETLDPSNSSGTISKIRQTILPSVLVDGGTRFSWGLVTVDLGGGVTLGPLTGSDFLNLRLRSEVLYRVPPHTVIDFADVGVSMILQNESIRVGKSFDESGKITKTNVKVTSTAIGVGLHLFLKR